MSVFRYRTEAERYQAQQDHEFVWGVINEDERVLSQLPPGLAAPQTFLHFLQQGDLSDEALAVFDSEALIIVQSLRQHFREKNSVDLSEWHAEWVQSEQERKGWVVPASIGPSRSLLMQPADINLRTHDKTAQQVPLNYWGEDDQMPPGARDQQERWAREAQAGMHQRSADVQEAPIFTALDQYAVTRNDLAESMDDQVRQMQGALQKHCGTEYHDRQRDYGPGY